MSERGLTHLCVVRSDLPSGVAAAQLVHAAGHSVATPLPPDVRAVVLTVANECALLRLATRLSDVGIAHHVVREPDPPWNGAAMAIGVVPIDGADRRLRWATARLGLYRHEERTTS